MPRRFTHLLAAIAFAMPSLVCAQQPAAQTKVAGPSDTAAKVGDRVITVAEVDEAWRQADASSHAQAAQALYDGRKQALDKLLADMLIEQAAKAKGVSTDQFAREEITRRTKPISDADVAAFYEQNVSRMQGKSLQDMRGGIRNFLQQQRFAEARDTLVSDLRRSGPAILVALDPPRQTLDVEGHEPARGGGANAPVVLVEYSDYQ